MSLGLSLRTVDVSMLGYRVTRWAGMPQMHIGNGKVSIVHFAGHDSPNLFTNLYTIRWPMDETVQGWTLYNGYKLYHDFGDGSKIGGNDSNYYISGQLLGYLEDSNIIFIRHEDCGVQGIDVEVYYFAPMQSAYLDSFIVLVTIKNNTSSSQSFYIGVRNPNDKLNASVEYSTVRNAVTSKDSNGKTWILGSPDQINAVLIDDDWRTTDYTATSPGSYAVRWYVTVNPDEMITLTIINAFGNTESDASSLYDALKALNGQELLDENVQFWKEWLNEEEQWTTGIYEIDQLLRLSLCLIKGSITPYQSIHSGIVAFWQSEWPSEIFLCYWALALWGHIQEAKDYFAIRIKRVIEYIQANNLHLLKGLHIIGINTYETTNTGYSGAEYFELPITAVEIYKLTGDLDYAAEIWTWVKTLIDDMDANLITSGMFEGCFNWNHMTDNATYEAYWCLTPNNTRGTICVPCGSVLWIAKAYEQTAVLAEALGEYSLASDYRSKAEKMRGKFELFWNPVKRQYYAYWSDTEGFSETYKYENRNMGGNNYVPFRTLPIIPGYLNEKIREMLILYHHNLINLDKNPDETDNYLPTNCDGNFMLGKVPPLGHPLNPEQSTTSDIFFLATFGACVKAGLDDFTEHWLRLILDEYGRLDDNGKPRSFIFDIRAGWNATPWANYTMRRGMALLLIIMAQFFTRSKPSIQKTFEYILEKHGSEVIIFKPLQSGTDEFGNPIYNYDPRIKTKAIIRKLRADEEIVQAGQFTTEDIEAKFKAFTLIDEGDRLTCEGNTYQVQTIQKHRYNNRIVWIKCICRKVI